MREEEEREKKGNETAREWKNAIKTPEASEKT